MNVSFILIGVLSLVSGLMFMSRNDAIGYVGGAVCVLIALFLVFVGLKKE